MAMSTVAYDHFWAWNVTGPRGGERTKTLIHSFSNHWYLLSAIPVKTRVTVTWSLTSGSPQSRSGGLTSSYGWNPSGGSERRRSVLCDPATGHLRVLSSFVINSNQFGPRSHSLPACSGVPTTSSLPCWRAVQINAMCH